MFEVVQSYLNIAEKIAVIVGVCFLAVQIRQQTKISHADHDRIKKQSTIEFYNLISSEIHEFLYKTDEEQLNFASVKANKTLESDVVKYLSRLERLAVGVNSNIYDLEILSHIVGNLFTNTYNRLERYIKEVREKNNTPRRYCEFEHLVKVIERYREKNKDKNASGYVIIERRKTPKVCLTFLA